MKYIKTLGLLAVAAAALMAFAGTASATTITSETGSTPTVSAFSTNTVLTGPFTEVICKKSTVHGTVSSHGKVNNKTVPASGQINIAGGLTFTECDHHVTVMNPGSLDVTGTSITGNGTLVSTNAVVEVTTGVGICRIETGIAGTHIGTVIGGEHATINISTTVPFKGTSFFCGGSGTWEGTYIVAHPTKLSIH